jgi:hypothetical protein
MCFVRGLILGDLTRSTHPLLSSKIVECVIVCDNSSPVTAARSVPAFYLLDYTVGRLERGYSTLWYPPYTSRQTISRRRDVIKIQGAVLYLFHVGQFPSLATTFVHEADVRSDGFSHYVLPPREASMCWPPSCLLSFQLELTLSCFQLGGPESRIIFKLIAA